MTDPTPDDRVPGAVPPSGGSFGTESSHPIEIGTVRVRRAPKLSSFMVVGLGFGVILALVATFAFPTNAEFAPSQIFGFLLLICAVLGAAIGAVVALILGRVLEGRTREVTAERESTRPPPEV